MNRRRLILLYFLVCFMNNLVTAQSWEWLKNAGGQKSDKGSTIVTDHEGNIFITGYYNEEANFDTLNTGFSYVQSKEVFVAKMNPQGDFLWVKNGLNYYDDRGLGLCVDPQGNVYVTGTCWGGLVWGSLSVYNPSSYTDQLFLTKLDTDGNEIWMKNAGTEAGSGWYNDDHGQDLTCDSEGNILVTGFLSNNSDYPDFAFFDTIQVPMAAEDSVAFVAKLSNDGVWQWVEKFEGIEGYRDNGIAVDDEDNVYVAGGFRGTKQIGTTTLTSLYNSIDIYVAKWDKNGVFQFVEHVADSLDARADQICFGNDGHMYVTGEFRAEVLFGTDDLNNYGSPGDKDIFVSKMNKNGDWIWATKAGSKSGGDRGIDICANDEGNIFVGGQFRGNAKFGDLEVESGLDSTQLFVALIDSTGVWRWVLTGGGPLNDRAAGVAVDNDCNLYTTGFFKSFISLDSLNTNSSGIDDNDIFIAKIADPCRGFDTPPTDNPSTNNPEEEFYNFEEVNVFTPNNDGFNDVLLFCENCNVNGNLVILNRWGNIVYSSNDLSKGWNGKVQNGSFAVTGTYFYEATIERIDGTQVLKNGFIELRR